MNKKNIFRISAVLTSICTLFFASCSSDDPEEVRARAVSRLYKNGIVKVGIASSWENNITDAEAGFLMALDEVNESGIMGDVKLEYVKVDDDSNPSVGMKKAYELCDDEEISCVFGHAYSDISVKTALIYSYYGMIMFSPISTAHTLTRQRDSMIFRNIPDDGAYGYAAADFCKNMGWSNIIIYYLDVTFGESMANTLELACASDNITVVSRDLFSLKQEDSDYLTLFKRWKNNYIYDAVVLAGNMPQIAKIRELMRSSGITQPILGSDSFDDPRFAENLPAEENGKIYAITQYDDESNNEVFIKFCEKFEQKYGRKPDQEGVQWYDACKVFAAAVGKAGTAIPRKVAGVLRSYVWDDAVGPYIFDEQGDVVGRNLLIKVIKDGKFVKMN